MAISEFDEDDFWNAKNDIEIKGKSGTIGTEKWAKVHEKGIGKVPTQPFDKWKHIPCRKGRQTNFDLKWHFVEKWKWKRASHLKCLKVMG